MKLADTKQKLLVILTLLIVALLSFLGTVEFLNYKYGPTFVAPKIASFDKYKDVFKSGVNKDSLKELVITLKSDFPKGYIVSSGSMKPTIDVGSIVFSATRESYGQGDVITFAQKPGSKNLVTHRIVSRDYPNGVENPPIYVTSGDANEDVDPDPVKHEQIVGKVILTVPYIGYAANYAKQPYGFILLVIVPATIVIYEELKSLLGGVFGGLKLLFLKLRKKKGDGDSGAGLNRSMPVHHDPLEQSNKPSSFWTSDSMKELVSKSSVLLPVTGCFLFFTGIAAAYLNDREDSMGNVLQAGVWGAQVSITPTPTPIQLAQTLVIHEVLPDSSCLQGQTEAQWIEIYNGSNAAVNPKNFKLTDGTNTVDLVTASNLTMNPGTFLLLSHNSAIWNSCYSANGTQTGNLGGSLNIDVGQLKLIDTDGTTVLDVVRWNQAGDSTPTQNQSVERVPLSFDTVTGDNFAQGDMIVREMPTPGYGSNLVLNEFLPNDGLTFTTEWVEIYNPSFSNINLTGWTLDEPNQADKSLTTLGTISSLGFAVYDNPTTGWLNDGGETLVLKDDTGKIIDQRTFGALGNDQSTGRRTDRGNLWNQPCAAASKGVSNNGLCQL